MVICDFIMCLSLISLKLNGVELFEEKKSWKEDFKIKFVK